MPMEPFEGSVVGTEAALRGPQIERGWGDSLNWEWEVANSREREQKRVRRGLRRESAHTGNKKHATAAFP